MTLAGGALVLLGTGGERLDLPLASVARLRIGYEQNRYAGNFYRMKVWADALPRPLTLATIRTDEADYGVIARAIAVAVERAHGPGAIQGGLNWAAALIFPVGMTFGLIAATFAAHADGGGPHRDSPLSVALAVAATGVPILGVILWFYFRLYRPRRLRGLEEIERFLPRTVR